MSPKTVKQPRPLKIFLRRLERRDLPKTVQWLGSKDYSANYLTDYPVQNEREMKNQLLKDIALDKLITASTQILAAEAEGDFLVGLVFLKNIDWRSRHLDLQIYIPAEFRNTNIALLITNQAYAYVFKQLNMHKVYNYLTNNDREKIQIHKNRGHEPEAILYDYLYTGNKFLDLYIYAIYKAEVLKPLK